MKSLIVKKRVYRSCRRCISWSSYVRIHGAKVEQVMFWYILCELVFSESLLHQSFKIILRGGPIAASRISCKNIYLQYDRLKIMIFVFDF
jgi:hypothetical protein